MRKKICFISSSGGHFSELYKLKKVSEFYDSFLVVEKTKQFKTDFCEKHYFVKEINRKEVFWILKFLLIFIKELVIFIKERPSHVVSTGALCAYPMIKIARFFRKKVIYIESYARVFDLSKTGKKLYGKVDLFVVQWPELAEKYSKSVYYGNVFGVEE